MTTPQDFDPITCITAGEMRARGIAIPTSVPDIAWVPRTSIAFATSEVTSEDDRAISLKVTMTFTEPFRWVSLRVQTE